MKTSKYFTEAEFLRCTPPCSLQDIDQETLDICDRVREEAGIPMTPTCGYRSREWELSKGRSGTGDHPTRTGIDFRVSNGNDRMKIVKAAIKVGVKRIGVANTFVHIGTGKHLPQDNLWTY